MPKRCDMCGPYSVNEFVASLFGEWAPLKTGYLCPMCLKAVKECADAMATRIDEDIVERLLALGDPPDIGPDVPGGGAV